MGYLHMQPNLHKMNNKITKETLFKFTGGAMQCERGNDQKTVGNADNNSSTSQGRGRQRSGRPGRRGSCRRCVVWKARESYRSERLVGLFLRVARRGERRAVIFSD
jgi:hypothetical protein